LVAADHGVRTCSTRKFEKDGDPARLAQEAGEEAAPATTREAVDVPDLFSGDKIGILDPGEIQDGDFGERGQKHLEPLSYKSLILNCFKGVRFHKLPKHNRSHSW